MENLEIKSLTNQIKVLMESHADFSQKLKQRLVLESNKVKHPFKFIVELLNEGVLCDDSSDPEPYFGLNDMVVQLALMVACSKGADAVGGLMKALEGSGNSQLLSALQTWINKDFAVIFDIDRSCEPKRHSSALPASAKLAQRGKVNLASSSTGIKLMDKMTAHVQTELGSAQNKKLDHPGAVRSLVNPRNQSMSKVVRGSFFEQSPPLHDLGKGAAFTCPQGSLAKKPYALEFNKEHMIAHLADGTGKLWDLKDNEEKTFNFGAQMKDVRWFEYDDEILVLGTAAGTIHLFDARREEKWSVRLGEPLHSFRFLESTLVIRTQGSGLPCFWRVDISRSDMRLLNAKLLTIGDYSPGFFIDPDYIFVGVTEYKSNIVNIWSTKSGTEIRDETKMGSCYMTSPALMRTLTVVDLITAKRILVVGCECGKILLWKTCKLSPGQHPFKTLEGHTAKIVGQCAVKGHILSLDQSGKLLMWSGYDLENGHRRSPVARVLAENFYNVTSLVAHERWFASGHSDDGIINIWTLPDLWLRTG